MIKRARRSQSWVSTELMGGACSRLYGVGNGFSLLMQDCVLLPMPRSCTIPHLSSQLYFQFPFDCQHTKATASDGLLSCFALWERYLVSSPGKAGICRLRLATTPPGSRLSSGLRSAWSIQFTSSLCSLIFNSYSAWTICLKLGQVFRLCPLELPIPHSFCPTSTSF